MRAGEERTGRRQGTDTGLETLPLASCLGPSSLRMPRNALVVNLPEQLLSTIQLALIICGSHFDLEISPEKYFRV